MRYQRGDESPLLVRTPTPTSSTPSPPLSPIVVHAGVRNFAGAPRPVTISPPPSPGPDASLADLSRSISRLKVNNNDEPGKKKVEQVTFCYPTVGKEWSYVVAPLPKTYADAVQVATRTFSAWYAYTDRPLAVRNTYLALPVNNERGMKIHAHLDPESWTEMVSDGSIVMVLNSIDWLAFDNGPIFLAFSKRSGPLTLWDGAEGIDRIDRPRSFEHAVELVKARIKRGTSAEHMDEYRTKDLSKTTFTFCTFQPDDSVQSYDNLSHWSLMPEVAYTDETAWRCLVPRPGAVLGVIIEEK